MSRSAILLVALAAALGACGGGEDPGMVRATKPVVYTTFYPTTYFAQRIGGDLIEVVCPVPPDADPIFWKPDDATVGAYQKADLVVVNGADFEKWVAGVSLPESRRVDTAKPFAADFIRFEKAVAHRHGPAGEHAHEGIDGHTWLDPVLAKAQAAEIEKALVRLLPGHAGAIAARAKGLQADLDALDGEMRQVFAALSGQPLLASHPAYNYLARRYGLNLRNLDLDPETMPDDEALAGIRALLAEHPAKVILWESSPKKEIAKRFEAEFGLKSVEFSPCEMMDTLDLGSGEDFLTVMKRNLANLR